MTLRRLAGPLTIAAVVAVLAGAVPAVASAHRCGRTFVSARGLAAKVRIVRGPVSCESARRLIVHAYTAESSRPSAGFDPVWGVFWEVRGWRCSIGLAGSQTFCRRSAKEVDGSFRRDDGWTF
jgi:hypothetical protein